MFSFHTHEVLSSIHKVESDFWEEMLDKIYSKVVQKHKSCLGLISNTIKTKPNDKVGEFSENTQFLFKSKIDPDKHDLLLLIDKDKFNAIFQEYLAFEEDDRSDFYHLKEKYEIGFEMLSGHLVSLYGYVTGFKKQIDHLHADIGKLERKTDTVIYWIVGGAFTTILTLVGLFNLFIN